MRSIFKNIQHHFIALLFALLVATMGIACIVCYDFNDLSLIGVIGYISIIIFIATIMILCCRKWRIMRPYIMILAIPLMIISVWGFFINSRITTKDLSDYLQADTSFHEVASMFLPTNQEVAEANHVNYQHTKWLAAREYITISMRYDHDEYAKIKKRLSESCGTAIRTHYGPPYYWQHGGTFFLNGLIYQTYDLVYEHSYYAFAVCFCEETGGMSFIFISDPDLASVAVIDLIDKHNIT